MDIINTIITILSSAPQWVEAVIVALAGLKAITALTPTKIDDKYQSKGVSILTKSYNILSKVANILVLNVGKDKNADDTEEK